VVRMNDTEIICQELRKIRHIVASAKFYGMRRSPARVQLVIMSCEKALDALDELLERLLDEGGSPDDDSG